MPSLPCLVDGAKQGSTDKEKYTYDPVGNRLSSLGVTLYSYNTSNELMGYPGVSYTYDNNGNTKTKTDATGQTTYNWDFDNRLTSVVLPGTGGTVSFKYDPFGRRVQKSATQGGITNTTGYWYDGASILDTFPLAGSVPGAAYLMGGMDEPLYRLSWPSVPSPDQSVSPDYNLTNPFYEADGLASITSLSDPITGSLVNTYTYDSFGKLTASTGTQDNPFQYTAHEFDPEIGTYNYRARYYDQNVGRFLSEDPLRFATGVNFYNYVDANPTNYRDPSGKGKVHGNWCGQDWTGGRTEQYDPAHDSLYKSPVDATDTVCEHHDACYYGCRRDFACSKEARQSCMRQCDYALIGSVPPSSFWGQAVMGGIYWFNKSPDAGSNESCGCNANRASNQNDSSPLPPFQPPDSSCKYKIDCINKP